MANRKPYEEMTNLYYDYLDQDLMESVHYVRKMQSLEMLENLEEEPFLTLTDQGFEKAVELRNKIRTSEIDEMKVQKEKRKINGKMRTLVRTV